MTVVRTKPPLATPIPEARSAPTTPAMSTVAHGRDTDDRAGVRFW